MRITPTDTQAELGPLLRRLLADHRPTASGRDDSVERAGLDEGLWSRLTGELGILDIAADRSVAGVAEMATVAREAGRMLAAVPAVEALLAVSEIAAGDGDAVETVLPGILEGGDIVTVAGVDPAEASDPALVVTEGADGPTVTGALDRVAFGHASDVVVAPARSGSDALLVAVRRAEGGMRSHSLPTLDLTRPFGAVRFERASVHVVASASSAERAIRSLVDQNALLLAAESIGGAEQCFETTLEYVRVREQFGRPIGSFQAIKHRLADRFVDIEAARSLLALATGVAGDSLASEDEVSAVASGVRSHAVEAYLAMTAETLQMHGGIGFTWEHEAHLYLKRAQTLARYAGSPAAHRERVLRSIGLARS
jgi:alkylation response protein AidB-like acyl-CoA dehydrogenase